MQTKISYVNNQNKRLSIIYLVIFSSIGGILYGYDLGVISGALLLINKDIPMSTFQMSLTVGAVLGGGSLATLISGPCADYWGRKKMIIIAAIIFLIGTAIVVCANNFSSLFTGRIIQGIGVGIITIIIPLYLSETAPPSIRGRCVSLFQLFLTGGILLAYVADLFLINTGNWRAMFLCVAIPGLLLFLGSLFLPASPSWLFMKNKIDKVKKALSFVRTPAEVEEEFHQMQALKLEKDKENIKTKNLIFKKQYLIPFLLVLAIASLNQLTGINCILQYCPLIFKSTQVSSNVKIMTESSQIGLINFIITIIALMLVDKLGRKPLLVIGTFGIVCALLISGFGIIFIHNVDLKSYILLIGMILYIIFFAVGPGVVVWLALSELLPTEIRSKGMAFCLFVNSMVSTLLASVFLDVANVVGYGGIFLIFAFFTFLYFLIAFFILPETKGKSLEEIESCFRLQKR